MTTGKRWLGFRLLMCAAAACFLMGTAPAAFCGVYWESEMESQGMPEGLPPNMPKEAMARLQKMQAGQVIKNYITEKASRTESREGVTIMDFDKMAVYHFKPGETVCYKMDLQEMAADPQTGEMIKGMSESTRITPTDERKTIAGYSCRKYLVEMMMSQGEYWVTQDVAAFGKLMQIGEKMQQMLGRNPMLGRMNVAGMMKQLSGFPVQTRMAVMGVTQITTLTRIEERDLDDALFRVPDSYTIQKMGVPR